MSDAQALDRLVAQLRTSDFVCVDCEFMRERTYYPRLCLIQVATDDVAAIVDPFVVSDLEPLFDLLRDSRVVKVFHAGSQDLEIFYRLMGSVPDPLFDTQVAATLAGLPQQVGYGALVKHFLGESIDKSDTFTDWARRPLSGTQIEYALNDVRYLPAIYRVLRDRLEAEGRLEWLRGDFERMADPTTYELDLQEAWRRLKRLSSLNRRQLGVLREVAAWREREARRRDVPRKWVVSDESLVEIARRAPQTREELAEIRGVADKLAGRLYPGILEAVTRGLQIAEEDLPRLKRRERREVAEGAVDLMAALVRHRAKQHNVAVPLLASRDELERLAAGEREDSPLLVGWRRSIVGEELLELLDGRIALMVGNGGVVPVPTDVDGS